MLQTFHIIAIIQGIFLLIILHKNKKKYFFSNYFFLNAALISLLIFILGDENSNMFFLKFDLFLVDSTLFITFLLLFLKFFNSPKPIKFSNIFLYFIPVTIYVFIEIYEIINKETFQIELVENLLFLAFSIYLILSFYYTLNLPTSRTIKFPFYIVIVSLFIVYSSNILSFISNNKHFAFLNSVLIYEIAVLFYFLTYLFVFNIAFINLPLDTTKYKNSSLTKESIQELTLKMKRIMEDDKVFLNPDLSLQIFSEKTSIPKHYISEILNIHLNTTFSQFVNEYRINEFIKLYTNTDNNQYSIFGIATSVGFTNKATFNASFKKITGVSPSDYKKQV